jgi:hypothetical protein
MGIDIEERIAEVWGEPSKAPSICIYAQRFSEWTEPLCRAIEAKPDIFEIYKAKLLLLDRFFDYRAVVPKSCRYRMNESGHRCVWHIFSEAYARIRAMELSISPPLLLPPQPAPAKEEEGVYLFDVKR